MSDHPPHYDYIIAGAGASGLSLLMAMIRSQQFSGKKILLIDKSPKASNDRTWCFWERGDGPFEEIVYRKWNRLWYHGEGFSKLFDIAPYAYKMIRGIDFYRYCFDAISTQKNITIAYGQVTAMHSCQQETWLRLDGQQITAGTIFSSIPVQPVLKKKEHYLQQHFKGWIIETDKPLFDPGQATLMDFRVSQQHGTTFVYVMPFSPNRALVEYTLFTKNLLLAHQYDEGLQDYISNFLHCSGYQVLDEEFGVIPMTNHRFPTHHHNVIYLGTAGGQTKASSGYTFGFIQKHTAALVQELISGRHKRLYSPRYHFYDSVLLNVLTTGKAAGASIFTEMFKKNPTGRIFRFLDNESSMTDDIKVIAAFRVWPFLRAGLQELFVF